MKIVRVVDLSHPVTSETQVYPGDPVPHLEQHSTIERDGFNLMSVNMGSQSGTHVDAPFHFDDDGIKIDEIPLGFFVGRAVIFDCGDLSARQEITIDSLGNQLDTITSGDIAIFKTRWSRFYGTDEYFNNPYLNADLVAHLIERGVLTFGLDAINIDETPDDEHPGVGFPAHHLIAKVGGVICENLTNLDAVDFENPTISLLPLKFIGIDGAPVRAVAMQTE
jgi:kynurenine formamidase